MFYSLRGRLLHMEPGVVMIECGGVGFRCFTTRKTQQDISEIGKEAFLYTYLNVREDAMDLFGFSSENELDCFKLLLSVSGVGPKVGLSILSELGAKSIYMAILSNDVKTLTRCSGVGAKLAQRIILELKDKVGKSSLDIGESQANIQAESGNIIEAVTALSALGYSSSEAVSALAGFDVHLPVEELIKLALRKIAGGK